MADGPSGESVLALKQDLQRKAWEYISPVRSGAGLTEAQAYAGRLLDVLQHRRLRYRQRIFNREWVDALSLANMAEVMRVTAAAALTRQESRGSHYRLEHTAMKDEWLQNIIVQQGSDGLPSISCAPIETTVLTPEVKP